MKTTYLNIRNGLKPQTLKNMKKICVKEDINYGELLNRTYGNLNPIKKELLDAILGKTYTN